jgi:NAD-dependent SIR2 family protein deacetylase
LPANNGAVKSFQCSECNASFSIAAKLYMHIHKHHKNRSSTECPICRKHLIY